MPITNLSSNNSPAAIERYRQNYDKAFAPRECRRCEGTGIVRDYSPEDIEAMQCSTVDGQCVFQMREIACPACKKGERG